MDREQSDNSKVETQNIKICSKCGKYTNFEDFKLDNMERELWSVFEPRMCDCREDFEKN